MDHRSTELRPRSDPSPRRATVSAVRRLDVIDSQLKVHLRGSGPDDIAPADGVTLEAELAGELRQAVARHDFLKYPVAAGIAGAAHVWRMVRINESNYFAVLLEPSTLMRRVARISRRFTLDAEMAEMLRLTAAGYTVDEIAHRSGQDVATVEALRARLTQTLGCETLRQVVEMVSTRGRDEGANVLARFAELPADWQRLSSF